MVSEVVLEASKFFAEKECLSVCVSVSVSVVCIVLVSLKNGVRTGS